MYTNPFPSLRAGSEDDTMGGFETAAERENVSLDHEFKCTTVDVAIN